MLVLSLMAAHRSLGATLPGRWGQLAPAYFIGVISSVWFVGRVVKILVMP